MYALNLNLDDPERFTFIGLGKYNGGMVVPLFARRAPTDGDPYRVLIIRPPLFGSKEAIVNSYHRFVLDEELKDSPLYMPGQYNTTIAKEEVALRQAAATMYIRQQRRILQRVYFDIDDAAGVIKFNHGRQDPSGHDIEVAKKEPFSGGAYGFVVVPELIAGFARKELPEADTEKPETSETAPVEVVPPIVPTAIPAPPRLAVLTGTVAGRVKFEKPAIAPPRTGGPPPIPRPTSTMPTGSSIFPKINIDPPRPPAANPATTGKVVVADGPLPPGERRNQDPKAELGARIAQRLKEHGGAVPRQPGPPRRGRGGPRR